MDLTQRVGHRALELAAYHVRIVEYGDIGLLGIRLGHLARGILQAHYLGAHLGNIAIGHGERGRIQVVKPDSDIARQLQMLLLVHADRHQIRLVEQYIRRHEHRIVEQARIYVVGLARRLVLELGHAAEFAHIGKTVEHPCQLAMRRHMALAVYQALFGIEAASQQYRGHLQAPLAQLRRILPHSYRVQIHDAVYAVIIVFQQLPVAQRAYIVSQRKIARRLYSTEDHLTAFLTFHNKTSHKAKNKTRPHKGQIYCGTTLLGA